MAHTNEYLREWRKNNPEKVKAIHQRYREKNKEQIEARHLEWRQTNKNRLKKYWEEYREEHREDKNKNTLEYRRRKPWSRSLESARRRCVSPVCDSYEYYGGKGIEFHLTEEDIVHFWYRDNADMMDSPSLDRIDSDGHYEFNNCRFLELSENARRAHTK